MGDPLNIKEDGVRVAGGVLLGDNVIGQSVCSRVITREARDKR